MIEVKHYDGREPPWRKRIKQWLNRARWLDKQIDAKVEQVAGLRDKIRRCTGSISAASGSGRKDWTDAMAQLTVLEDQINADINQLIRARMEIREAIARLPTDEMRLLMELRYLNGRGWRRIAREMHFDESHIYRLHDMALNSIEIPKNESK